MNIDERKYEIINNPDGSITCVPKPFIPNSKDIQDYWDSMVFDKRQDVLSDIEYIYKVTCSICGQNVTLDYLLVVDQLEEEFDNLNEIKKYEKEV